MKTLASSKSTFLPLFLALPYLAVTYLLFFIGPYSWPIRAWWVIYFYIPAVFVVLTTGFMIGVNGTARGSDFRIGRTLYWLGSAIAIILLVPTALTYTGKPPWEIGTALADQRQAYTQLADQLRETEGTRAPLAIVRGLGGPFVFCVLPLLVMTWNISGKLWKFAGISTILASIDLSILRGTTRELADIAVVGSSALLIRTAISAKKNDNHLLYAILSRWKLILFGFLSVSIVTVALIGRTEARMGGEKAGCIGQSGVCADLNEGIYRHFSDTFAFGSATVTAYLSQGYYGLSLAAEKPFLPTWGLGHSPPLTAWAVKLGADPIYAGRTYTARADGDGWSDETQWSTLMAWIANDLTLWGALIFIGVLGFLWGKSWVDAVIGGDVRAAIFFCALMMMVFYLPANNQMMLTLENYMALAFWTALWAIGRNRRGFIPK
jgi:hypothetical protein